MTVRMGYDFAKTVGVPEKSLDFWGEEKQRRERIFRALYGNERYKVCDDESETTPLKKGLGTTFGEKQQNGS